MLLRDDLRSRALESGEKALSYVAVDLLAVSPRQLYVWRLRLTGLLDSELGQQWMSAVDQAGEQPIRVSERYRTTNTFTEHTVTAHVYQMTLQQGEQLVWQLSRSDASGSRLYASLERQQDDNQSWATYAPLHIERASQARVITQTGRYRIVLQPELLGVVDYSLAIASGGSLPWPVVGASLPDIGGGFGVARDGRARAHHGVDIFAKKGTPVTAVIDGQVRTGSGGIGGNHVWLSGGVLGLSGARYYYAHLDSFAVESGDSVKQGAIVGYVGNTGNAKNTPPHLHFGIYSGGPVDPMPFLKPKPTLPTR